MVLGVNEQVSDRGIGSRLPYGLGAGFLGRLRDRWQKQSLTLQFTITAALVISIGMAALGTWVNDRIKSGVVQNSASNAALYLVGFVEPHVQELGSASSLTPLAQERVDSVFRQLMQQRRIVAVKVWAPGGKLAYSSDKRRVGQTFPETERLKRAWKGTVEPEYDDLSDEESEIERLLNVPMLEIYAPIRDARTNEVIAVAEVYEIAEDLASDLQRASLQTALMLGSIALVMIGSLFHIVRRGSRTIEEQQSALSDRVNELSHLLRVNKELQRRIAVANRRTAETNEQFLRRIGADLHDGPAQLIGFGLLRLDALRPRLTPKATGEKAGGPARDEARDDIDVIQAALSDGLRELRAICADIAIPELRDATPLDALRIAVQNHEHRTGSRVIFEVRDAMPARLSLPLLTCVYRFVQEGLNNAFRHAGGKGQKVCATYRQSIFEILVSDEGDGITAGTEPRDLTGGLGLRGLRDRILSMGGEFETDSSPGHGTRLVARFMVDPIGLETGN